MLQAVRFFTERITALNDESRHDPVKGRTVVKLHFYEIDEVFDVTRSILRIEANLDPPFISTSVSVGILISPNFVVIVTRGSIFLNSITGNLTGVRSGRQGGHNGWWPA